MATALMENLASLTPRQRQVYEAAAAGKRNAEIATELGLSYRRVAKLKDQANTRLRDARFVERKKFHGGRQCAGPSTSLASYNHAAYLRAVRETVDDKLAHGFTLPFDDLSLDPPIEEAAFEIRLLWSPRERMTRALWAYGTQPYEIRGTKLAEIVLERKAGAI